MILFIKMSFSWIKFLLLLDNLDIIAFANSEINKDLIFKSECLLNHKHETDKIEYFLSDKIKEPNYCCLEHETQHYIQFCKQCNKNIL